MTATTIALRHTIATIRAATGTPVWAGVVPEDAPYPCVLVAPYTDAADVTAMAAHRVLTEVVLSVRVITKAGDLAAAETIYNTIDGALQGSGPTGRVAGVVRTAETVLTETEQGTTWQLLGGIYRVSVAGP